MTTLILYILLWLWDNRTFDSITRANERKLGAEQAFENGQYSKAAQLYYQITYGSLFSDPAARLNLAHAYYRSGNYRQALKHYTLLEQIDEHTIASIANSQIALIQVSKVDTAGALTSLKTALRLEPGNNLARTNYIILKKTFSGIEGPSDNKTSKKQSEKQAVAQVDSDTPPQPAGMQVAQDDKKEDLLENLKAMNMTEDQARSILDAMKSNESQYIYQLRRKQYAEKSDKKREIEW